MLNQSRLRLPIALLILFTLLAIPHSGEAATVGPLPTGFMPSVRDYGAKGDGVTDDTAAIKRALADGRLDASGNPLHDDFSGRPKALYFPAGTYLVNDTLEWIGCCFTVQGAGSGTSVIRLKDRAAGFGDQATPKPVIRTISGNMSFEQNIWNLTIDTGNGNSGAVGLDWISNNSGGLHDITVQSGDGAGVAGIDMTRQWPGPCLLADVLVKGFAVGIDIKHAEYGPTFERITLRNQRVAGIRNAGNTLAIRGLRSENSVPAISSTESYGSIILLDGELTGGAASASAIDARGYVYARNVTSSGYRSAVTLDGTVVPSATHVEYISGTVTTLFDSPKRSLNLPIEETPTFNDPDASQWIAFTASNYGDTSKLQALLDSGKSTIYFPFGTYFSYDERAVIVPASVRRIIGFSSVVNSDPNGKNGGGIRFIVADDSSEPLIIERFNYGIKVEQRGARPVAIKSGSYRYTAQPGAGKLFLEDVGIGDFRTHPGQKIWARQFNNESKGPKIVNTGASLWILGLKTEVPGTVIETNAGGSTELLGTLIYPAGAFSAAERQQAAFISRDSRTSLIYSASVYCAGCGYEIQIEETRAGVTKKLLSTNFPGRMALFAGFPAGGSTNQPPTVQLTAPLDGKSLSLDAPIALQATASDPDGNIAAVSFYDGPTLLGEDRVAPYCFPWNPTAGVHTLSARASDNAGATANSNEARVTVSAPQQVGTSRIFLPLMVKLTGAGGIQVCG